MSEEDIKRAKSQARTQIESIVEMIDQLEKAEEANNEEEREEIMQTINEDPLSIEVRNDWHIPGNEHEGPTEYKILLCTGGPACQIIGELNQHNEPDMARVQYQDWLTPWIDYIDTTEEEDVAILKYAQFFYYSE